MDVLADLARPAHFLRNRVAIVSMLPCTHDVDPPRREARLAEDICQLYTTSVSAS